MSYATVNGLQLYYERHGSGAPLVLLHGGFLTIELTFGGLVEAFARNHDVIAIELQGHGRTADTEREMTFSTLASDVVELLNFLEIAKADLFGFSLGALVALTCALEHPRRVNKLVVASTNFRPEADAPRARRNRRTRPDPADVARRMPTPADFQAMRDAYAAVAPDPSHFEAFAAKAGAMVHSFPGFQPEDLESVTAPTLLIFGDTDFVPFADAQEMFELIPDAQLAILPGTTHMGITRSTDRVRALVDPFLTTST